MISLIPYEVEYHFNYSFKNDDWKHGRSFQYHNGEVINDKLFFSNDRINYQFRFFNDEEVFRITSSPVNRSGRKYTMDYLNKSFDDADSAINEIIMNELTKYERSMEYNHTINLHGIGDLAIRIQNHCDTIIGTIMIQN